jgi:hypothetical protein
LRDGEDGARDSACWNLNLLQTETEGNEKEAKAKAMTADATRGCDERGMRGGGKSGDAPW